MDKSIINTIIIELKDTLKKRYPDFKGIYFYGSMARGEGQTDSDYDLVFVFSGNVNRKLRDEIIDIVYEYELAYGILIDVKVYSASMIENPVTPFRKNVLAEGIFYGI